MRNLTIILIALITFSLAFSSFSQAAPMSNHMEIALIDVCKSAMSNKVHKLNRTIKAYRLKNKTVALKVVCNGDDIITFAEKNGAYKTAAKLQRSIGHVDIINIAAVNKQGVTIIQ